MTLSAKAFGAVSEGQASRAEEIAGHWPIGTILMAFGL